MDALREPRGLVERVLDVATHLCEKRLHRSEIAFRLRGELEADREPDQALVDTVVQLSLDPAAVGIRGQDEPPARRVKVVDLRVQSRELPLHVDLPSLQLDRLLPPDHA
jgi:hypothetical protein